MKRMYGKLGLGLAGAIATVGLMSAGVQTAQAQLELQILTPTVTQDSNNSGLYTWTYFLQLTDGSGTGYNVELANDQPVTISGTTSVLTTSFTISNFAGYDAVSGLEPYGYNSAAPTSGNITVQTNTVGDWSVAVADGVISATYTGSNAFQSSESPNYTGTDTAYIANTTNKLFEATPGYTLVLGEFQFDSIYNSAIAGNYVSLNQPLVANTGNNPGNPSTATFSEGANQTTLVPVAPLPPAFWPSVLTLAGMAAVGGLRLRNRAL